MAKAPDLQVAERPPTVGEVIQMGEEVAMLFNAPVFRIVVRTTLKTLTDAMVATAPHETKKRDFYYGQVYAMSMVMTTMQEMVGHAQVAQAKIEEEERVTQQHPIESQGFDGVPVGVDNGIQ